MVNSMADEWTIGSEKWKKRIQEGAESLGIVLPRPALDRFSDHALELMHWNSKFNLTAITDPLDVAVKHYIDSIAPANLIPQNSRILDIGSGAGFPAIPLKIVLPTLKVTVIDAVRKKVSFLSHSGRMLNFKNYRAVHLRIDSQKGRQHTLSDLQKKNPASERNSFILADGLQGQFDVIVARALASLDDFLAMALPLTARKGRILAWKGRLTDHEIDSAMRIVDSYLMKQVTKVGTPQVLIKKYKLPYLRNERSVFGITFD
jgi:16S rRNA (guanine527-N7)-methyltransferase